MRISVDFLNCNSFSSPNILLLLVQDVGDLKYLNESHLDGIGVRLVQREKLKEKLKELNSVQTSDELRLPKRKCVIS